MEEDIKILEEFKTKGYFMLLMKYGDRNTTNFKLEQAIEHLIKAYKEKEQIEEEHKKINGELREKVKQLEEENASKQKAYDDCYCEYKHYKQFDSIPKSKVKEKIEEYDKKRIKIEKDDIGVGFTLGKEWSDLKAKIEVLQELLREE